MRCEQQPAALAARPAAQLAEGWRPAGRVWWRGCTPVRQWTLLALHMHMPRRVKQALACLER